MFHPQRIIPVIILLLLTVVGYAAPPVALILSDPSLPSYDNSVVKTLSRVLQGAGYAPAVVTVDELLRPGSLDECRLLVTPGCRALPGELIPPVMSYLKRGGGLFAMGAPAWDSLLLKDASGRWVTPDQIGSSHALEPPENVLLTFPERSLAWEVSTDHPESSSSFETVQVSFNGRSSRAAHVKISNLSGWNTFAPPVGTKQKFPDGMTDTVFSARGGPRTRSISIEWEEKDGSRWIAAIPLGQTWRQYRLVPSDFKAWQNSAERTAQGFHPQNALRCHVGMAFTHTGTIGGAHEFWISEIGASHPLADTASASAAYAVPILDTLAPKYKFFNIHGSVKLQSDPGQVYGRLTSTPFSGELLSTSPRPAGSGFMKGRKWRWIPILQANDSKTGEWRGTPITLMLHSVKSDFPAGAWLVSSISEPSFYQRAKVQQFLQSVLTKMRNGLFLMDTGAEFYTYTTGQPIRYGCSVMRTAGAKEDSARREIRTTIAPCKGGKSKVDILPLQNLQIDPAIATWKATYPWPAGGYRLSWELIENGNVIDRLQHTISHYDLPATKQYVTRSSDGHFLLNGKRWRINGINYMPSSGIAQEDGQIFEQWLSKEAYDPEVIDRDLDHVVKLGMNAVSVFVYRESLDSQNLIDYLMRCRARNLKVNLSLRPGMLDFLNKGGDNPLQGALDNFTTMVRRFKLGNDDTIFAYETAWEPAFGNQQARLIMDPAWRTWVTKHYNGEENAEKAWGVPAPRNAKGELTNPPDIYFSGDKREAVKIAADYRSFLDEWLDSTYGAATKAIKSLAPRQMVSFRMASAGNPSDDQRSGLPYQFEGLTRAVDFLSPECYGRVGSVAGDQGIRFEAAYARAVGKNMPVIWAETGVSAWDMASSTSDPANLDYQGTYIDTFYRIARESDVDGLFFWWYPGGYRTGENSDYGIINADGTYRPSTLAILKQGRAFLTDPPKPAPDVFLPYTRSEYPDGVHGIFSNLKDQFFGAIKAGKHPTPMEKKR